MNIIKNGNTIIVVTNNGDIYHKNDCSDESLEALKNAKNDEEVTAIMCPAVQDVIARKQEISNYFERVKDSNILSQRGESIYWDVVSKLSMPETLVNAVLKAEAEDNQDALEAYHNFWVLMSLNPDAECRKNLFWFLDKWGMKISKSGMFIGYRNVDIKNKGYSISYSQELCDFVVAQYDKVKKNKKSPFNYLVVDYSDGLYCCNMLNKSFNMEDYEDYPNYILGEVYAELKAVNFIAKNVGDDTVYTDHHSHTFTIKVGEKVSMPREETDTDSNVSCSRGLHIGGLGWLKKNYFGDQGLVCLVNPAKVVAVPHIDDYGKLRTCEYLPIALVDYDEHGEVIPYNVEDGFDSKWVKDLIYDGDRATETSAAYAMEIPDIPELSKALVDENLYNIAKNSMK